MVLMTIVMAPSMTMRQIDDEHVGKPWRFVDDLVDPPLLARLRAGVPSDVHAWRLAGGLAELGGDHFSVMTAVELDEASEM